jgi:phage-related protein
MKPLIWLGDSIETVRAFPADVRADFGFALFVAQNGGLHPHAKPLKGFGGAGVIEIVARHDGSAYRAVYTVRFSDRIYVLHAFQKKSKSGIATPQPELDLIRRRLKLAERDYAHEK